MLETSPWCQPIWELCTSWSCTLSLSLILPLKPPNQQLGDGLRTLVHHLPRLPASWIKQIFPPTVVSQVLAFWAVSRWTWVQYRPRLVIGIASPRLCPGMGIGLPWEGRGKALQVHPWNCYLGTDPMPVIKEAHTATLGSYLFKVSPNR